MIERFHTTHEKGEESIEKIRDELRATGKVAEFIDAPEQIPTSENLDEETHSLIAAIDNYLTRPIVLDAPEAFENHEQRRAWRLELPVAQREVYENNALALNPINAALGRAQLIIYQRVEDKEEQRKLLEEVDALIQEIKTVWEASTAASFDREAVQAQIDIIHNTLKPFLLRVRALVV